jgi:NAD(P)-dependent dehydrogenase (short-subunit alcohol dehydrogenase family)
VQKTAIVTGAGSGIGRHTAFALVEAGFRVALAGRRRDALAETASLTRSAESTLVIPTDVRDPSSVSGLFRTAVNEFGRLDLLFNNAGINVDAQPLEALSLDDWRSVIETNLTGAFLCAQEAFRIMKDQRPRGGRIINNGSVSAQSPRPYSAPYTAAKHAVTGLTKSMSLEGRKHDIACGQIDIGNALTDLSARLQHGTLQADGTMAEEPMMNVKDVARAVVYMASLPLEANVPFITVMATKMPLVGRG